MTPSNLLRSSCLAFLVVIGLEPVALAEGWKPPLGVPAPAFGIKEVAPVAPNPWGSARAGFYYVDASQPSATDSGNPLGTPSLPRRTVPLSLPAGAVVELHGQYGYSHTSPNQIEASGTAARPVFIRGKSASQRPLVTAAWQMKGSYFILENLEFEFAVPVKGALSLVATDHAVVRNSDVHGNLNGGGIAVFGNETAATQVVIYNNLIHDNGDVQATYDQDVNGVRVAVNTNQIWVIDNQIYRNSGDGVNIYAGSAAAQATTHHIYVGRNVSHDNKQTGFWSKQAVDVIFSENLCYSHRPSNSSYGQCMGFQYAPERVWFLFNHIHDCDVGIALSSDSGLGSGQDSYFIGNVIHNIHHSGSYNPNTAWSNAGFMLAGGVNRYVINNTIHDVDAGINSPGARGAVHIVNNIISEITEPQGSHVFVEMGATASASVMHHNLLAGALRIKWGGPATNSLSRFQASLNADPLFVNPAGEDFRLQAVSPAVDAGVTDPVYSTFLSLYGIDIAKDIAGKPRPQGPAIDLGAYERTP
jgi:hypothetical protein